MVLGRSSDACSKRWDDYLKDLPPPRLTVLPPGACYRNQRDDPYWSPFDDAMLGVKVAQNERWIDIVPSFHRSVPVCRNRWRILKLLNLPASRIPESKPYKTLVNHEAEEWLTWWSSRYTRLCELKNMRGPERPSWGAIARELGIPLNICKDIWIVTTVSLLISFVLETYQPVGAEVGSDFLDL